MARQNLNHLYKQSSTDMGQKNVRRNINFLQKINVQFKETTSFVPILHVVVRWRFKYTKRGNTGDTDHINLVIMIYNNVINNYNNYDNNNFYLTIISFIHRNVKRPIHLTLVLNNGNNYNYVFLVGCAEIITIIIIIIVNTLV